MSSPNPDVQAATLSKYGNGEVKDNVLTKTPFLGAVEKFGEVMYSQGGVNYQPQAFRYNDGPGVEQWSGRGSHQIPDPVMYTNPTFEWTGGIVQYIDMEVDALENQAGDTRRFNLAKQRRKDIENDWQPYWEAKLWLDGSSLTPTYWLGVPAFLKATGTYGTLAQTNSYWAPYTLDGSSGVGSVTYANDPLKSIRYVVMGMAERGAGKGIRIEGEKSIRAFTTSAMYQHILSYHQSVGNTPITVSTDEVGYNFANIVEHGVRIYYSPSATASEMAFLDFSEFEFVFQTPDMFKVRVSESIQPIGQITQMYTRGQLVHRNPWKNGRIHTSGVS
jgi:hypothetical protein